MLGQRGVGREQVADRIHRELEHACRALRGVYRAEALGLGDRELLVAIGDRREEVLALLLEAIRLKRPLLLAQAPGLWRDPQEQRPVGCQSARREQVDGANLLDTEATARSLVGERGVDEAVEQHQRPVIQERQHSLLDQLGSCRRIQKRLGAGADLQLRILDEVPDALGELHAARLAHELHRGPVPFELVRQRLRQRRLSGAVDALDRDEPAPSHAGTVARSHQLPAGGIILSSRVLGGKGVPMPDAHDEEAGEIGGQADPRARLMQEVAEQMDAIETEFGDNYEIGRVITVIEVKRPDGEVGLRVRAGQYPWVAAGMLRFALKVVEAE